MEDYILIIDGGTTNTRFTLVKESTTIAYATKRIGASDSGGSTGNHRLEEAVKEAIGQMEATHRCRIGTVLAAGMITSNAGLMEVAHLEAPVALKRLAASVKPCRLPHISQQATFYFVPGIKFNDSSEGHYAKDILRGEETEIYGAVSPEDMDKTILFIHFGSHNKIIRYSEGTITKSITTISGELLWALANSTILKSSVGGLEQCEPDPRYVLKGYFASRELDLTRSLFMARINQVMGGATGEQTLSYLYGCLMYSDLKAFSGLLREKADKLVLYGRDHFIKAFLVCLPEQHGGYKSKIEVIGFEDSQKLSINGLKLIYRDILENVP